jgi:hypothetical protein
VIAFAKSLLDAEEIDYFVRGDGLQLSSAWDE